jgi:hypothetical protein
MVFHFPSDKLVQNLYNVVVWHLLFLLPQWCFTLPLHGEAMRHKEMWIQFKHFLVGDWEYL